MASLSATETPAEPFTMSNYVNCLLDTAVRTWQRALTPELAQEYFGTDIAKAEEILLRAETTLIITAQRLRHNDKATRERNFDVFCRMFADAFAADAIAVTLCAQRGSTVEKASVWLFVARMIHIWSSLDVSRFSR